MSVHTPARIPQSYALLGAPGGIRVSGKPQMMGKALLFKGDGPGNEPKARVWPGFLVGLFVGLPVLVTALSAWVMSFFDGFMDNRLDQQVGDLLKAKKLSVATAESCTGGLVSSRLTNVSGSSDYTRLNLVTYSSDEKTRILGVSPEVIAEQTAACEDVARQMAIGARQAAKTDVGISTTGFVGPDATCKEPNPYGLAYIGIAMPMPHDRKTVKTEVRKVLLQKPVSRIEAKRLFSKAAMEFLKEHLQEYPAPAPPPTAEDVK